MKENNFLKHFFVIGSGTMVNMLIGLITTPLITRLVDPNEYGRLSIFTMYGNMAVMILCLGLDQALVRFYYEKDSLEYRRALLIKCVYLPVILSCVISVLVIIASQTGLIEFEFSTSIMVMLCVYTIVEIFYRFSFLVVRLEYRSKMYAGLHILQKASYLIIALTLIAIFHGNYLLLMVVATVSASAICLTGSIIVQKDMWNFSKNNPDLCHITKRELIVYSAPFILSMGITTLFQAIDKISLNYYRTYAEVGIYSSTMTIVNIFAIVQTTFNALWAPMQIEHYSKNPENHTFYQQGNQIITVIMFFIGICLILVKDVFAILLGEKYREAAYILPFLIFQPIMYTVSETTVGGLVFMKKSRMHIVVAAVACITNMIGNIILVPRYGCQGAAISTGLSYIVFFSMRTFLSNRYYYTDFKLKKFYLLTAVVIVYAFYNTFISFNIGAVVGWFICCVVLLTFYWETIRWMIGYVIGMVRRNRGES